MLNKIIKFAIYNKLIVVLMVFTLIVFGVYNASRLPIDAVPDITNNQVLVITPSPSLGAADIERLITFPIEQSTRNIAGIIEQRSFSRFGLSLVTIVFDDKTDVYWARQQVSERLSQVQNQIPPTLGIPQLGPVTTGLGEIFQYVVKPKPGYEKQYTAMELRTIQDWIVRRQLLGTEGVADVSSFGGNLKQYEISVNASRLNAHGLSIDDLLTALEKNNQNTGGAYIEKGPTALFIRSEGLIGSIADIGNIMVKVLSGGAPVKISDIAEVKLGYATRYGAVCYNDQGEVAGAVVMMLKNENSSKVIKAVKEKIAEIEKTLPEGVSIEPFLDRTKMVNNAIHTVERNLLEGALIVVFILVIFLGNLRAGLLVASVIPLSMLFAIIMMNIFGVSGNLMSLGALDFGLIVDGAVIIVEAVMHRLHNTRRHTAITHLDQNQMNLEVGKASGKMMNAAVFGQIIILIVYLPILSLQGIEGKMFRPMAQTVAFAILGAFLLSLTYIPMMSSLVLSRKIRMQKSFSDRMMQKLERFYTWSLRKALAIPRRILVAAIALFVSALAILFQMGGEFIPKLEEGDFAVDTRVLTGSSLATTINQTQKASHILLAKFPEVEKVVTKIGSGEIPTDPMPIEASDMMVILKPKSEWTSASTFDELAEKMSFALEDIPGITAGFQFPVQMRFNELMTGGRQDVVCKIFGENIDTLALYAEQLGKLVNTIDGAKDIYVETVTGLPQIVVTYNRAALAQYGLSVERVNRTLQAAFAGAVSGQVFEDERRFDLVIRLDSANRGNISDVQNLLIARDNGEQIPLRHLGNVQIKTGPNQIQRENAQRRITVGFNVRGRDVETTVNELKQKVDSDIRLPVAYYITYGGQFENLVAAKKRLSIAVPVSLLLILMMLHFAFNSLKQGLLVYSAIPLSAVGGVLALWLRDMPFSISAGVGFIALFGVAVLNGIVLITEFNHMKKAGVSNVRLRILKGTRKRLRPVLMTASVASLGFLPMALSSGAGAEVQRPLATVVIGGLITATLLTLIVLPIIYEMSEKDDLNGAWGDKAVGKKLLALILPGLLLISGTDVFGQEKIALKDAIDTSMHNSTNAQIARLQIEYNKKLEGTAWDIPATSVNGEYGQFNSAANDKRFSLSQTMAFPIVYQRQKQLLKERTQSAILNGKLSEYDIKKEVSRLYYQILIMSHREKILLRADSFYNAFLQKQELRFRLGDANILEKTAAESQRMQITNQLNALKADKQNLLSRFNLMLNAPKEYIPDISDMKATLERTPDTAAINRHPHLLWQQQQSRIAWAGYRLQRSKFLPHFSVGYNIQSILGWQNLNGVDRYYNPSLRFSSVNLGISIPIFYRSLKSETSASLVNYALSQKELEHMRNRRLADLKQLLVALEKNRYLLNYYETRGFDQLNLLTRSAADQFQAGTISYMEWIMLVNQSLQIESDYLNAVSEWNDTVIELNAYISH